MLQDPKSSNFKFGQIDGILYTKDHVFFHQIKHTSF